MEVRLEPAETHTQVRPDLQLQPAVGRGPFAAGGRCGTFHHSGRASASSHLTSQRRLLLSRRSLPPVGREGCEDKVGVWCPAQGRLHKVDVASAPSVGLRGTEHLGGQARQALLGCVFTGEEEGAASEGQNSSLGRRGEVAGGTELNV